jgi:hypothetical protein
MEDLIKQYIHFDVTNTKGWNTVKCACCHDYKVRGGFVFDNESIGYHCFNCGIKSKYYKDSNVSKTFHEVLSAFGVPDDAILKINFSTFGNKKQITIKKEEINKIIELPNPAYFKKIADDDWSLIAREYLEHSRGIADYSKFLICNDKKIKNWYGRLIIPFYREGKLVYYQGRSLIGDNIRYMNAVTGDTVVLYNYDEINRLTTDILFVVEGVFDAIPLNGVAILGNDLSDKKVNIINQSKRRKVYIPDKTGGMKAALSAISAGWEISVPDIGNCKDINEAIMKYGILYTNKSIMDNIYSGFKAKIILKTYCT